MCLAELGEGVARGARPIRVIDATSSLQESLSLAVGHRALLLLFRSLVSHLTGEKSHLVHADTRAMPIDGDGTSDRRIRKAEFLTY